MLNKSSNKNNNHTITNNFYNISNIDDKKRSIYNKRKKRNETIFKSN